MSTDRDITSVVRAWLEEGVMEMPEHVLDSAMEQLPAIHQRRAQWPAWRLNTMSTLRLAALAAAFSVIAVVFAIVPRTTGPSGQNGVESPSPSPSPSPSAVPFGDPGSLAAGTYYTSVGNGQWTVSVPDGWEWFYDILWADLDGKADFTKLGGPGEVALGWWTVDNVFADPCHWKGSLANPPVGPTVDDLANALVAQVGRNGSGPTDVVLGGQPAKKIELSVPTDLDVSTCDQGAYREFLGTGDSPNFPPDAQNTPNYSGRISEMYILDVGGARWFMNAWHNPDSSLQHVADLEAMLASIRIDQPAPSSSPAPSPSAAG